MDFIRAKIQSMYGRTYGRNWWDVVDYPAILWDQHFGTGLVDSDLFPPTMVFGQIVRPRTRAAVHSSGQSEVKDEIGMFQVKLNLEHFQPDEVEVKVVDKYLVIHGKHEEKTDEHGFIKREFTRRYVLPEGTVAETIKSSWNSNGMLTIEAPKKAVKSPLINHRVIPISIPEQQNVEDK